MAMVAYGKLTGRCEIVWKRPLSIESLIYPTPWFSDISAVCRLSLNLMHASTAHLVVAASAVVGNHRTAAAAANSALTHSLQQQLCWLPPPLPNYLKCFLPSLPRARRSEL